MVRQQFQKLAAVFALGGMATIFAASLAPAKSDDAKPIVDRYPTMSGAVDVLTVPTIEVLEVSLASADPTVSGLVVQTPAKAPSTSNDSIVISPLATPN